MIEKGLSRILRWPGPLDPIIFVIIAIAYFLPWIDHPTAGLTLIGLDVSEWVKFLPQMQSGELPNRDYFYLPPIFLGGWLATTSLLFKSANKRVKWVTGPLALAIGLVAFPSLDALRFEPADQWRLRLIWIGLLGVWALVLIPILNRTLSFPTRQNVALVVQLALAAGGVILPALVLLPTRRVAAEWLNVDLTNGVGFWLSSLGFAIFMVLAGGRLWLMAQKKAAVRPLRKG